jgi:hypothetical protein
MEALARLVVSLASYVTAGSLLMLAATEAGTPERTITVFALTSGLVAIAISGTVLRLRRRGRSLQEDEWQA